MSKKKREEEEERHWSTIEKVSNSTLSGFLPCVLRALNTAIIFLRPRRRTWITNATSLLVTSGASGDGIF